MCISLSLLGNGSVKIPFSLLGKGSVKKNVTAATNTHGIEELLDASFSMWPV
jgi:hypothetical protein